MVVMQSPERVLWVPCHSEPLLDYQSSATVANQTVKRKRWRWIDVSGDYNIINPMSGYISLLFL